jgi:anaerobic selenocysteine-containing dehydrogenase
MSAHDAAALDVGDGDTLRVVTAGGAAVATVEVSEMMQPGHVSLPNGMGIGAGVAPNELTSLDNRDWLAGTPLHKYVPARLERV